MARTLPKPQTISQKTGIRYENALFKRLQFLANTIDGEVEHNPWFEYYDDENELRCAVPDFIFAKGSFTLVIECKLTFVPEAVTKLRELYVPLVEKISRRVPRTIVKPLVVCKTMSPLAEALPFTNSLKSSHVTSLIPQSISGSATRGCNGKRDRNRNLA